MTDLVRQRSQEIQTFTGDRALILSQLRELHAAGNRVSVVRQLSLPDRQLHVEARVIPFAPEPARSDRRWALFGAGLGGSVAAVAGVVWLLHTLFVAIADHIVALVGIAVGALIVLGFVGRVCVTTVTIKHRH